MKSKLFIYVFITAFLIVAISSKKRHSYNLNKKAITSALSKVKNDAHSILTRTGEQGRRITDAISNRYHPESSFMIMNASHPHKLEDDQMNLHPIYNNKAYVNRILENHATPQGVASENDYKNPLAIIRTMRNNFSHLRRHQK